MISTKKVLEQSLKSIMAGEVPVGENYLYGHKLTPVEPYAAWIISACEVYRDTAAKEVKQFIFNLTDIYFTDTYRPHGKTFHSRNAVDKPNGIIGQAIIIKALSEVGILFDRKDCQDLAEELFLIHPFDREIGLWRRIDVDGSDLGIDNTLNHQICFAAYSLPLLPFSSNIVKQRINRFMDCLNENFQIRRDGRIKHLLKQKSLVDKIKYFILDSYNFLFYKKGSYRHKEPGYHSFNLMLLSILYEEYQKHSFFTSQDFLQSQGYIASEKYLILKKSEKEPNFFTNTDFLLAVYYDRMIGDYAKSNTLLENFFSKYYDIDNNVLGKNCSYPDTMASSIYLLSFLKNTYDLNT